jgi:sugar transferase (PEP-CTERM/EpsH1 system associated)
MDGIIAARMAGIQSIVHGEHGWEILDLNGHNPRRVLVRKILSRCVWEYTCVSKQIQGWLEQTIRVTKPVTQIYNGVDIGFYSPNGSGAKTRVELDISPGAFVLGTVGRLDPIKDYPTLLRAFEHVKRRASHAVLLIVGDGPERNRLKALAGNGVFFLGERTDVPQLLRTFNVFVLPSRNEGISNTILEAMATSLPVIATRVGGNPELVEEGSTGFLVPPGDFESMASTILCYFYDKDLKSMHGRAARDRAVKQFSVEKMVRSYEEVYRRIAHTAQN